MFGDESGDYTDATTLRRALTKLRVRVGDRLVPLRGRSYGDPTHDAILKVNARSDGSWHWVVWDATRSRLIDPRQPPYKRIRAVSFLVVVAHR